MSAADLLVVGLSVFAAAFLQAIAGFGFGLLSVPLMTLAISPKQAVVVATLTAIIITTWQAWQFRADARPDLVRRMSISAYIGMPLGLWVFVAVNDDALRIALGIAVLIAVALLAARVELHHAGPAFDVGAGFVSGVLNTSLSTNGPPLVFALQARRLEANEFRATIVAVFAFSNVLGLALFIAAGKVTADGLLAAAIALPALALGQLAGFPIRKHVHGERFRWLVLVLLTAAAASAISAALR